MTNRPSGVRLFVRCELFIQIAKAQKPLQPSVWKLAGKIVGWGLSENSKLFPFRNRKWSPQLICICHATFSFKSLRLRNGFRFQIWYKQSLGWGPSLNFKIMIRNTRQSPHPSWIWHVPFMSIHKTMTLANICISFNFSDTVYSRFMKHAKVMYLKRYYMIVYVICRCDLNFTLHWLINICVCFHFSCTVYDRFMNLNSIKGCISRCTR